MPEPTDADEEPTDPADVDELLEKAREEREQPSEDPAESLDAEQAVQGFEDVDVPSVDADREVDVAEVPEFEDDDFDDVEIPERDCEEALETVRAPESELDGEWKQVDVPELDVDEVE